MIQWFGTEIFWITIVITFFLTGFIVIIGNVVCDLFPKRFQLSTKLYLAPVFGLATLVIIFSNVGRFFILGNKLIFILTISLVIIVIAIQRKRLKKVLRQIGVTTIFGIIGGVSILVPLFLYGSFNSHNDAFTYLAHSTWLQSHAFNQIISHNDVTPLTTQIALYQENGFRMGSSFLLAAIQSISGIQWPYEVYPSINIVAIMSGCLAIIFPIAKIFNKLITRNILILGLIPTVGLGGIIFGANFGFLPQTVGITFGVAFLVVLGFFLYNINDKNLIFKDLIKFSLLISTLFASSVFAYSEIMPFLVLTAFTSCAFQAIKYSKYRVMSIFFSLGIIFSIVFLNTEIIHVIQSLLIQSNAIVGGPVNWTLLAFVSHAFGMHGGAWDIFQWLSIKKANNLHNITGFLSVILCLGILLLNRKKMIYYIKNGFLMPIGIIITIFTLTFLYFRYLVQSPFEIGIGQSWSQFKISDWINIFLMTLVLFSIASFSQYFNKFGNKLMYIGIIFLILLSGYNSMIRMRSFNNFYGSTPDVDKFYISFFNLVEQKCKDKKVYLNFSDSDIKLKQMLLLYSSNKEVLSNWIGDVYISNHLPQAKQKQLVQIGDCVIESNKKRNLSILQKGTILEPVEVGIFRGDKNVQISNIINKYNMEQNNKHYWYWVDNKIVFKLQLINDEEDSNKIKLFFKYNVINSSDLTMNVVTKNNDFTFELNYKNETFNQIININPSNILKIIIRTKGKPVQLSKTDLRNASFMIKDIQIKSY